jgi:pimeloyl-ACP methyl ester carboxylesterase
MSASAAPRSTPDGLGSVSGAPNLPTGFTDTFTSRYIDTGALRLHAVIGGEGPPLLLVHGWPETWYAWRLLMPALARDFVVIAVDQRGIGLTDTPEDGYDRGTLAGDLVALMDALGHARFAVVGHDTGYIISSALAADHPHRVARVALAEIPGPPVANPSPPLFVPEPLNNRLWHIPFNRVDKVPEQLVCRWHAGLCLAHSSRRHGKDKAASHDEGADHIVPGSGDRRGSRGHGDAAHDA